MANLKSIRARLGLSQSELGDIMGCVQGNITAYEREVNPRPIPQRRAAMLIASAKERGLHITFDHVYGDAPLPSAEPEVAHA